jgi:hypothetical protein
VRYLAQCATALVFLLTACSAASPPASPFVADASRDARTPLRSENALLYASDAMAKKIYVYSFPGLQPVEAIANPAPFGLCSDTAGNVWASDQDRHDLQKYSAGGTKPIAVLADKHFLPNGCAVDPLTGDLAVVNQTRDDGNVAIYPGGTGPRQILKNRYVRYPEFCAYDASGDLFVDGVNPGQPAWALTEMRRGQTSFILIKTPANLNAPDGDPLQWDGAHLALSSDTRIYRLDVKNAKASVVGTTTLEAPNSVLFTWIGSGYVAGTSGSGSSIELLLWKYPDGGAPVGQASGFDDGIQGVTVSGPG